MRLKALFSAVLFAIPFMTGGSEARAGDYHPRQYYSHWYRPSSYNYYYRYYYYKPYEGYHGYKHHYVFYYPRYGNYYYYYNPYKKAYWGRCPVEYQGTPQYSLLPQEARKGDLDEIQPNSFPKPGPMPPIPDSKPGDNVTVDLPPDDLPTSPNNKLPPAPKQEVAK